MPFNTPVYLNTYKFQDAGAEKEAVFRHKLAMFLTGFIMLTPHRIAVLCAPHLVKRFHLPPSVVPLFIYKIHNPMELASFVGTVMQVLLSAVLFTAIAENQKVRETLAPRWADSAWEFITGVKGSHEDAVITNCKRVASIICGWVMFITSIFTFIFFISGDDYGYLGQFYWSVIIMAFANGIYSSFSFGVNVNAAIYAVGLPLSGFFTFLFHNCCRFLSNKFNWEDYDYTFVKLLIISTMLIQFITASWWTMDQIFQLGNKYNSVGSEAGAVIPNNSSIGELFGLIRNPTTGQKVDANNNNAKQAWSHWSPILMLSISLGTVYAFYPAITPYQLMDVEDANNTDFYIQFISAIPTLVIGILDESGHGPGSKDGYDGDNWYDKPEWNCFWIAAVPYVLCLHIFITMIHFPDGLVSTFLHSRPRLLQAICVSFNFWQEILEIVGFSAAGKQSNRKAVTDNGQADGTPKDQIAYNGHVGMVNNFLFLFTMAITMFVGDGYLMSDNTTIYLYWVYGDK